MSLITSNEPANCNEKKALHFINFLPSLGRKSSKGGGKKISTRAAIKNRVLKIRDLRSKGKGNEAYALASNTVHKFPNSINARFALLEVLIDLGKIKEAEEQIEESLKIDPLETRVRRYKKYIGGGEYLYTTSEVEEAFKKRKNAKMYLSASIYLNEGSLYQDAEVYARKGLDSLEDKSSEIYGELLFQLAFAYEGRALFEKAIECYETIPDALKIKKRAASSHARCLLEINKLHEAQEVLNKAGVKLQGEVPYNAILQSIYYLKGEIKNAHEMYRDRATSKVINEYFNMPFKPRDLELKKTINKEKSALIISEGGPGDEIRMASFYNELSACFKKVTITCDPRLEALMNRSFPEVNFLKVARHRNEFISIYGDSRGEIKDRRLANFINNDAKAVGAKSDIVCSILDAISEFRHDATSFLKASRLKPDPNLVLSWHQAIKGNSQNEVRVGVAWRSMLQSNTRDRHYIKLEELLPIFCIKDIDFYILQPSLSDWERDIIGRYENVHVPNTDLINDFDNQAALMSNLNLVISPFTTTAELAGMVGCNTVLFSRTHITMWRKRSDNKDIWYETGVVVNGAPVWDVASLVNKLKNKLAFLALKYQ